MNAIKEEIGGALLRLLLKKTEGGEVLTVGEDKVIITHEQCPAVLLSANKNLPEILLVQKFTGLQIKQSHISTGSFSCSTPLGLKKSRTISSSSSDKPNDDMDVTGSPLKCPFMQTAGESNDASPFTIPLELCNGKNGNATLPYLPIPSTRAGLIASKLNLALCKLEADLGEFVPLWVACDGRDAQGMLFIGMHRGQNTHHRTLVTSGGPYEGKETLPSLDHIMRHHTAIGPKKVDSAVKATYSIMASENEVRGSSLSLTCTWKRPFTVLSSPSPDAFTMANVRVVRGDPRSPTFKMHSELDVLKHFVNGLETGEVLWLVREDSRTIAEELEEVFTSIREKGARVKREDEGGCEFDMMIQGKFFNWRLNMDITDQLWNVLMRCESYQELKDSLSLVFKAVAGEDIKPQFHACNTTQVGSLLRNLMRGRGSVPELTGLTPLHMLIELGCEKIKRDYISIFQAEDLVTGEQLMWFVGDGASGKKDMAATVNQLERLHVALQVVVALRTYLNLPWASLTHFTNQVLNQMKEEQPTTVHSFSLKLDTLSVHRLFDSMKVDTWEVSLHGQEGTYSKPLVCCVSQRPIIQFSSTPDFEEHQEGEDQYFCTFFSSVTDRLMLM